MSAATSAPGPQLVVLGNLLLDDIVYADGRTRMGQPGGAALYVALGAARAGLPVGIVSRLGDDYPPAILAALAEHGIVIASREPEGPTLRTWLLYEGRRRRVVHRLDGPSHADVSPRADEIPSAWKPRSIHLAPMPWEIQKELVDDLGPRTAETGCHLSVDPYELLTTDAVDEWRAVFGRVDTLFLSEDEMQIPGGIDKPLPLLERLGHRAPRLRSIFYKQGAKGGLHWRADASEPVRWPPRPIQVTDPTGAGDSFAGGVLAGRLRAEPLDKQLERGLDAAARALAGPGANALLRPLP